MPFQLHCLITTIKQTTFLLWASLIRLKWTGETLHMSQQEKSPLWIHSPEETSRGWIHGSRFSVPVPYYTQLKHTHNIYIYIYIYKNNLQLGTPVHEVGHALGLWHEQQRSDRDSAIRILWDNLGYYVGQFYKQATDNLTPYDYASVMHYAPKVSIYYQVALPCR